ncbi:AAA family ATPase [Hymenobacter sp. PAMC 26628]|uniref:AAA family ATPase n=1 Tax=Hymenobacter sp. PAMC 26628 TaxID=1484118 RepID=UPI0009020406|nr:ATP-binding protein [Hymenobacter sp. PAMC 26628]
MLKRLHIKNFTVFADADFEFGPGLNVLVGTNGTGKSHVLKLGYAVAQTVAAAERNRRNKSADEASLDTLNLFAALGLSTRLSNVFLPGTQNRLVRNISNSEDAQINSAFGKEGEIGFNFSIGYSQKPSNTISSIDTTKTFTSSFVEVAVPVFIPAKEILSLMPDIVGISKSNPDVFDSTYSDLATQLTIRAPQVPPVLARTIVDGWAKVMQGTIQSEDGRFYFQPNKGNRFRIGLAAEGFRKLGTLIHLLTNGSLNSGSTLFWDEPEANLNPALLRQLAAILAELARQGFQIILATHSTDLLKEFHILSRQKDAKPLPIKYFGLNAEPGEATRIVTTDNFELLPDVVALAAELKQADELEEIFIREDREYYANNRGEQPGL